MTRRAFVAGAGAVLAAPSSMAAAPPRAPIYIADMHFHLFFGVGRRPASSQPLGPNMAKGRATLVSWSLVGDMPWLKAEGRQFLQKSSPATGDGPKWLLEEATRVKAHLADNKIALVRTPADIVAAQGGKPHVVLSVEGATFADDGLAQLRAAYDLGIRHLQLVHFIENSIGDMQTRRATRGGLTAYGRDVVAECNRLGILIDLAHCTEQVVYQVLDLSTAPVVWSHSSVYSWPRILPTLSGWKQRQLSTAAAERIAAKGGVIGLWALGEDVGRTPQAYADRMSELATRIGEDHVAIGSDMNALSQPAVSTFTDLRAAVDHMLARGDSDVRVRKLAMDNYARVLTAAMKRRTA